MIENTVEIWRDIKDYEGLYQVSNLGRVRSLDRYVENKGIKKFIKSKLRKQHSNDKGYLYVELSKNNKLKSFRVHRLVAMTFPDLVDWTEEAKGKPFDEIVVNHKNQIKTDNRVDNLEWCDMEYQVNYGDRNDIVSSKLTNRKDHSKPVEQYTLDMVFVAEYPSIAEAERQTGISKKAICHCLKGKSKTSGGYIWRYKD